MPRKSSPRKNSPHLAEAQPAVAAPVAASAETSVPLPASGTQATAGPVLVDSENTASRKPLNTAASASLAPSNLQEAIRQRAFEIYQQRGRSSGNAVDDWLRAEREVLAAAKNKSKRQPA